MPLLLFRVIIAVIVIGVIYIRLYIFNFFLFSSFSSREICYNGNTDDNDCW